MLGRETMACVRAAIDGLPARQARVLVLRDVEGWEPEEARAAGDVDAAPRERAWQARWMAERLQLAAATA